MLALSMFLVLGNMNDHCRGWIRKCEITRDDGLVVANGSESAIESDACGSLPRERQVYIRTFGDQ